MDAREPPPPPLDYPQDQSLRAIRRGVRELVFLTLVNTTLLGAGLFAPQLVAFAKQEWAAYQQRRVDRAAEEKKAAASAAAAARRAERRPALLAAQAQAMSYRPPADTLVYADDFAIGTLPLRGATSATLPATRQAIGRGTSPAAATQPSFLSRLIGVPPSEAILFLHARRARPETSERIVLVTLDIDAQRQGQDRYFHNRLLRPIGAGDAIASVGNEELSGLDVIFRNRPSGRPLRLYAGQPDATDASRFTIDYELGDARGQLVGRLLSTDRVELTVAERSSPVVR